MNARVCSVLVLLLACMPPAYAGEIIRFDATARSDVVLTNVPVKALVTEFLDPGDTGLGKSIGYLAWREILTAVSDQAGAGVILARAPGNQRLTDLLEQSYHYAAVRIAREQNASMAVWGAVNAEGGDVYVSTYLSILPESAGMKPNLKLAGEPAFPPGFEAGIERTNFNFPLVVTSRAALFERAIVTKTDAVLRAAADATAAPAGNVAKGHVLTAVDMDKGWFKVRLDGGTFAYLDNSAVDVPPRTVEADHVTTGLASAPAGTAGAKITLDGSYKVLDMRYVDGKGLWYELAAADKRGWISAGKVRPRFSLPMVHFVAGLYRYQFKRYDDAQREFTQYTSAPESAEDNASLAAAYQLTGASQLLAKDMVFMVDPRALVAFDQAVAATPYDPTAYSLRALSVLALKRQAGAALPDLEQALRLDPGNATATRIAASLNGALKTNTGPLMHMLEDGSRPAVRTQLETLVRESASRAQ